MFILVIINIQAYMYIYAVYIINFYNIIYLLYTYTYSYYHIYLYTYIVLQYLFLITQTSKPITMSNLPTTSNNDNIILQNLIPQLVSLLQQSISSTTTQGHQQIYKKISEIQLQPLTYIALLYIASNSYKYQVNLRRMCLILLKTTLKRNHNLIEFTQQQFATVRTNIINLSLDVTDNNNNSNSNNTEIHKRILISPLITWNNKIDYQILGLLVNQVNNANIAIQYHALNIIKIIFEDLKYETQNYGQQLNGDKFIRFINQFAQLFAAKFQQGNIQIEGLCLKCFNLILRHIPTSEHNIVGIYLQSYLLPLLNTNNYANFGERKQKEQQELLQIQYQILEGIIQISQLPHSNKLIIQNQKVIQLIINYIDLYTTTNNLNKKCQTLIKQNIKQWLSLIITLIILDSQNQQKLITYIPNFVPKIVRYLLYTAQDQQAITMQMEQQSNPYTYQDNQLEQQQPIQDQSGANWRYTVRKLAIICLERVITQYTHTNQLWNVLWPTLKGCTASNILQQKQVGALLIGIIFSHSQDNLQYLQQLLQYLLTMITSANQSIVIKCTSLWSISKLSYLIVRQPVLQTQIQGTLLSMINTNDIRVSNNVYMVFDQLINCSQGISTRYYQLLQHIATNLQTSTGKPLYCIIKIIITIYQRFQEQSQHLLQVQQITDSIIQKLCLKWKNNQKVQSIICPIIQCLVVICSATPHHFDKYCQSIFQEALTVIMNKQAQTNKEVVIRIIDLISAIIALKNSGISTYLSTDASFHQIVTNKLLCSSEQEIVNFSFGLIGDICKSTPISEPFAEAYIANISNYLNTKEQASKKTSNAHNLTLSSNCLTCLTDLLVIHPQLAHKNNYQYSRFVITLACKKLSINNLSKIYAFNFARIYGRLGAIVPECGAEYIQKILMPFCIGLRAGEHHKLTDDAYEGILKMVNCNPQAALSNFEYLVDSYICYPCQNQLVHQNFVYLLKSFKSSMTETQWKQFLNKPIFLPAVARKINDLSNSQ